MSTMIRRMLTAASTALVVITSGLVLTGAPAAAGGPPGTIPVDPAACAVTAPIEFGAAPTDELAGGACRRFTVTGGYTSYLARAADADNATLPSAVYGYSGSMACAQAFCNLSAGTYYLVVDPGAGQPYAEPFRATVAGLFGAGCEPVTGQGFSDAYRGTFAHVGAVGCLELPVATGQYQVTLPPAAPGRQPLTQLVQEGDAFLCNAPVTTTAGCTVRIDRPTRLIVVNQGPAAGDYQVGLQRLGRGNTCAALAPGKPGAPGSMTVPLSGADFVTCFAVPAGGSGSEEVLTLDRVEGDGTARLSVYDYDGILRCADETAAAYQQIGCTLGDSSHMVVVRSATGAGKFRISQVTAIAANCAAPASTAFGGVPTAGSIAVPGDVRCYRVTDNSWIGTAPDSASTPTVRRFGWDGGLYTCATLPCLASGEVIVSGAEPVDYRLDTWAVGYDYAEPVDCDVLTDSTAYGFGPITGTFTATDRAACVSVPMGLEDDFRLTVENAVPWVINGQGTIARCAGNGATWTCSPRPAPSGDRALIAFLATGTGPFRAEATCADLFCDRASFSVGGLYNLTAGSKATVKIYGNALHQQDTVTLTQYGRQIVPIVVRSVDPSRTFYTAEIDLTGVEPGSYEVTATSYGRPERTFVDDRVTVLEPQLAVTTGPTISGPVVADAKVTVKPGVWSPAVDYYSYYWYANGEAIRGARDASFTIPATLRGQRLTVTVIGHRLGYRDNTVTTAAYVVGYGPAAKATTKPKITGTVKVNRTVKVSVGVWSPRASSYGYEWRVNGVLVATSSSLKLKKSWAGKKLTVTVIAKRTGHYAGKAVSSTIKIKK
ncbi:hypothetical protein [Actinoplanes sp. L3-i22]|uniref:hypothetical protein n=1 Tax=Actinoplanes sp. L3-i22 TaxID=2836373 RepID=UPI001C8460A4|nr:hypothetical protein [Actinoplanes sp. L3-i22]